MYTEENKKLLKKHKQIKRNLKTLTLNLKKKKIKRISYHSLKKNDKKSPIKNNTFEKCKVFKINKYITINEFSNMIGVSFVNIKRYCLSIGIIILINQVLDTELLTLISYKFGYIINIIIENMDNYKTKKNTSSKNYLCNRPPIVTVMGHIDHGKTSLLDYIRKTNIIEKESGGITQHIGVYNVEFKMGKSITFIDTPGHEAFTTMRAKGTKITDIIIIIIDSNDNILPQTKEAIYYANTTSLPTIFALNKIDKPTAQPENIRKQLAEIDILVEEWGGKYQSQEISAKTGIGIEQLLEKVWLEAEFLNLMANPFNPASGTIIESSLDKNKGYITNILVQDGTIKIGDYISSGIFNGKIKAIYDQNKMIIHQAGPSKPVYILGLDGPAITGDKFNVFLIEKGFKKSIKKKQLQDRQNYNSQKNIKLDEIDRKMTLTKFNEMNIILKGDVVGSIEALTNAINKISTKEISINIINKGIGMISEADVLLASVSNAIIIGFNIKSTLNARKISEHKNIEIRLYSVIYDAINDIKNYMNSMYSPKLNEQIKVIGKAEIRNIYNIKKMHTIAGCMVIYGKIYRHLKVRLLREGEGIILHQGELASLKRFKEDVREVLKGYECGLNIKDYNDIKIGDIIEVYETI